MAPVSVIIFKQKHLFPQWDRVCPCQEILSMLLPLHPALRFIPETSLPAWEKQNTSVTDDVITLVFGGGELPNREVRAPPPNSENT